jgi:hypothetical protein
MRLVFPTGKSHPAPTKRDTVTLPLSGLASTSQNCVDTLGVMPLALTKAAAVFRAPGPRLLDRCTPRCLYPGDRIGRFGVGCGDLNPSGAGPGPADSGATLSGNIFVSGMSKSPIFFKPAQQRAIRAVVHPQHECCRFS